MTEQGALPALEVVALEDALARRPRPVPHELVVKLRRELVERARRLPGEESIRLRKDIVADLLACGRYGMAALRRELADRPGPATVLGSAVGMAVRSWFAHGQRAHERDDEELWLAAVRIDQDPDGLDDIDRRELAERRDRLVAQLRLSESWWPRTEVAVSVALNDRVGLAGRFDVAVGGPPTALPHHLIEIKSMVSLGEEASPDVWFYVVLGALRYVPPPASVVLLAPGVSAAEVRQLLIEPQSLRVAFGRVLDALEEVDQGLRGEPSERVGIRCARCPFRERCAAFAADERGDGA